MSVIIEFLGYIFVEIIVQGIIFGSIRRIRRGIAKLKKSK